MVGGVLSNGRDTPGGGYSVRVPIAGLLGAGGVGRLYLSRRRAGFCFLLASLSASRRGAALPLISLAVMFPSPAPYPVCRASRDLSPGAQVGPV